MAARIDYAISVTPIQTNTEFEGVTQEAIDSEIGRTLSASKSDSTWGDASASSDDIADWAAGVCTHKTSNGGTLSIAAGTDGVWIKNTGFNFDNSVASKLGTTTNDSTLTLTVSGGDISSGTLKLAVLQAKQGIFLPTPNTGGGAAMVITFSNSGSTAHAVEHAILT